MKPSEGQVEPRVVDSRIEGHAIWCRLTTGDEVLIPLENYMRLGNAEARYLKDWRLIGDGVGVHWFTLDEDVSISAIMKA